MQHVEAAREGGWMSRDELCAQLKISRPTIQRHHQDLEAQGWDVLKLGRRWRYRYRHVAESGRDGT